MTRSELGATMNSLILLFIFYLLLLNLLLFDVSGFLCLFMYLKKNFPLLNSHGRGSRQLGSSAERRSQGAAGGLNMIGIIWQKRKS